jgi:hypothetical protein
MGYAQTPSQKSRYLLKCAATVAAVFVVALPCGAQSKAAAQQQPDTFFSQELNKYPGLLPEFGKLLEKLQEKIQFPPERSETRLLPLLPASTISYTAIPNYGEAVRQAVTIFRQELQESSVLRDWWEHGEMAKSGPKFLDSLEKLAQLHEYLGDEIVVAASLQGQKPNLLLIADVRKPGLKNFLQESLVQLDAGSKPGLRILDLNELATAEVKTSSQDSVVLIRPGFVIAAPNVAGVRSFNAGLDHGGLGFASTPFGQRTLKEYESGVTLLESADLQKILKQADPNAKPDSNLQRSGFADVKYLVWDHKRVDGQSISETEVSFNGPRRGSASWLAKPRPLNSLDFVSPKAIVAGAVVLTNPALIFDDVKALASTPTNSNPFPGLAAFEKVLNLTLRDDLLSTLTGELTLELDSVAPPRPTWKAVLSLRDSDHLQKTLGTLVAAAHLQAQHFDGDGFAYDTILIPAGKSPMQIGYAVVDGHLIIASSPEGVAEAVRVHRSGNSLAKSDKFLASLPPGRSPGHSAEASALLYEDPAKMTALSLRQVAPAMAESLGQVSSATTPAVVCVYGEETAIREVSRGGAFDVGGALIVAAIAIPNLLRSRMAANEASAVGSLRTLNTAQVTYAGTYERRGYAPNMATFGSDPHNPKSASPEHAGMLDESLANDSCTGDAWCTRNGYQFRVKAMCKLHLCEDYVTVAKPVDSNTGTRSFCSTSDLVIRYKPAAASTAPTTATECKSWSPIK